MAGSGTCQHPARRELRDVVLVRQTELACRNSWDQDLWEPSPDPVLNPALTTSGTVDRNLVLVRGADHDSDSIDGDMQDDLPAASVEDEGVDRVTDIQMPAATRPGSLRPHIGLLTVAQHDAEDGDEWPGTSSVHEARLRRERERKKALDAERRSRIASFGEDVSGPESPDTSEVPAPFPFKSTKSFGVIKDAPIPVAGRDEIPDELLVPQQSVPPSPFSSREAPTATEPLVTNQLMDDSSQGTEPLPTREVQEALATSPPVRPQSRQPSPPAVTARPGHDDHYVHVDGIVHTPPVTRAARPQVPMAALDADDPIDRVERLAALARCCGTCRDFRQVGNGDVGQCVNPYAFSARRMVKSDQLACRSSLGTWWMPNDDIWLERADTSHHGRPTPLLDATLRAQRVGDDGRDSHA